MSGIETQVLREALSAISNAVHALQIVSEEAGSVEEAALAIQIQADLGVSTERIEKLIKRYS